MRYSSENNSEYKDSSSLMSEKHTRNILFGFGIIAVAAATFGYFNGDFDNDTVKTSNDMLLDCAVGMLEPEDGISEAVVAVERCDILDSLSSAQVVGLADDVVEVYSQLDG